MAHSRAAKAALKLLAALGLTLTLVLPAAAQGSVTMRFNRLEKGHDGMLAYVTVQDQNGVPIANLQPANFAIIEDGQTSFQPQALTSQVDDGQRLTVALVVDLSGSLKDQALEDTKQATANMLAILLNQENEPDRAAFFGISGAVNVDDLTIHAQDPGSQEVDFTYDRNLILNTVNNLQAPASRQTPLYDALVRVIRITALQAGPRAVVVITDGFDPN
jgi:hypothetical protein